MQKKFMGLIAIRYFLYVIYVFLANGLDFPAFSVGLVIVTTSVIFCIGLLKKKMFITPFLPAEVLLICFGLFKMNLVTTMRDMSVESSIIIILSIALWQFVCCLNKYNFVRNEENLVFNFVTVNLKIMTYGLFGISSLFMLVEWAKAGGIPVLQANSEIFRFSVSFNSIWHIIAMSIKYVPMFACLYFMAKGRVDLKRDKFLVVVSILSIILLIGTTQRGELLSAPVIILFAFMAYKKPKLKSLMIPGIIVVLFMGVYPIFRGYNMYGNSYIYSIAQISNYREFWFLTPVYQTFAYSFHVLNRDFELFPAHLPFGYGGYTILCNIPFLNLHDSLGDVQNAAWNNNFYAELTPTFFGDWYADFGYLGCFLGMAIIAIMLNKIYSTYVKRRDAMSLALYAFNFYKCICMLYDNTFDFVWITYFLMMWIVFRISKGKRREI